MPTKKLLPLALAAVLLVACVVPPVDPVANQSGSKPVGGTGPQLTDRLASEVDPVSAVAPELPLRQVVPPPTGPLGAPPQAVDPLPPPARMTVAATGETVDLRFAPGTDQPLVSHLHGGERVEVVGRSADGHWLQVVDPHTGHRAWVYGPLTDIDGATVAALAVTEPITVATLPPERDLPKLASEEIFPQRAATVTTTVNLRAGPGTAYAQDGQARAGDVLLVLGRNADGSWLQVANFGPLESDAPGGDNFPHFPVWVHAPLLVFYSGTVPPVRDTTVALRDVAPELWPRVEWLPPYMLPGIVDDIGDYDLAIVWRDGSAQWDWTLPNGADCHDGLRVFLGELPQRFGIAQFVLTLTDPPVARNLTTHAPGDYVAWRVHAQPDTDRKFNLIAWPDWEPTVGDRYAVAGAECVHMDARFGTDTGTIACDVYPLWGQPGHWLDGAINIVLAHTMGEVGFVATDDRAGADAWLDFSWPDLAGLMPLLDYTAVGPSLCAHVSRSQ